MLSEQKIYNIDDEKQLILRAKDGDIDAKEILIEKYNKMIYKLIHKNYHKCKNHMEDIYQECIINFLKAIDNYDMSRNVKFSTYVFKVISTSITTYLFRKMPLVKNEKRMEKLYPKIKSLEEDGYSPEEISEIINEPIYFVERALNLPYQVLSIDYFVEDNKEDSFEYENNLCYEDSSDIIQTEFYIDMEGILNEKQIKILNLRIQGMTYKEIGDLFGVSYQSINKEYNKIIKKISEEYQL